MTYVYPVFVAENGPEIVGRYALETEDVEPTLAPPIRYIDGRITAMSWSPRANDEAAHIRFWEERSSENCQYCGQLYPREKFYGGCPSCGAPHE